MRAPVLLIRLRPWQDAEWERVRATLEAAHPETPFWLLSAGQPLPPWAGSFFREIWQDGAPRGPGRWLALMRRLSWGGFAVIYDGEGPEGGAAQIKLWRFLVRPAPEWRVLRP
jgi:hypothetical protein